MSDQLLHSLIEFATQSDRVCPIPPKWNELWKLLPDRHRVGAGWNPALPLILAAWWDTSAASKRQRMTEHLTWAAEHRALPEVNAFLRGLEESDWLHEGEAPA